MSATIKGLTEIRQAVADYIWSEGCSCCEGSSHKEDQAKIGELLKIPKYKDDSGYDFSKFRTHKHRAK